MSLSNKISKAGGVPQFTADEKLQLFDRDDRKFITSAPQIAISQFHFLRERERERERDLKGIIHTNRKNNKKPLTLTLHVPCLGHFPVRGCLLPFEPNGCWKSHLWGGDHCWRILDKLCQYLSFVVWYFCFLFFCLWYFLHFVFLSLLGFFGHLLLFNVLLN
jgi:hypothetical protein